MVYEEIVEKIIDLLKADSTIKQQVKKYHFGIPTKFTITPCIYVERMDGDVEHRTHRTDFPLDPFEVVAVNRHPDEDESSKIAWALGERIEAVLRANPTIGDLVTQSMINGTIARDNRDLHYIDDYSVHQAGVLLVTRRLVSF